jgi:hypothetical protein
MAASKVLFKVTRRVPNAPNAAPELLNCRLHVFEHIRESHGAMSGAAGRLPDSSDERVSVNAALLPARIAEIENQIINYRRLNCRVADARQKWRKR